MEWYRLGLAHSDLQDAQCALNEAWESLRSLEDENLRHTTRARIMLRKRIEYLRMHAESEGVRNGNVAEDGASHQNSGGGGIATISTLPQRSLMPAILADASLSTPDAAMHAAPPLFPDDPAPRCRRGCVYRVPPLLPLLFSSP